LIEILLQLRRVQRRGHDDEAQIRPVLLLQIKRAGQRDVAVKMPLVKLVENQRETPFNCGSSIICRSRTPSVTKRILVLAEVTFSKRIW
jgi:hypothetical protein